jgi:hypothetical protein
MESDADAPNLLGCGEPLEAPEDPFAVCDGDAGAVIPHLHFEARFSPCNGDGNFGTSRGVLECVVHEVAQDDAEAAGVRHDRGAIGSYDRHRPLTEVVDREGDGFVQGAAEGHAFDGELKLVRVQAAQVQQFGNERLGAASRGVSVRRNLFEEWVSAAAGCALEHLGGE